MVSGVDSEGVLGDDVEIRGPTVPRGEARGGNAVDCGEPVERAQGWDAALLKRFAACRLRWRLIILASTSDPLPEALIATSQAEVLSNVLTPSRKAMTST